jgi:sugar phosphate isomerase/epimerase
MKLGLYSRSLDGRSEAGASAVLERVALLGLDGCLFVSPFELSQRLESSELHQVRARAEALGVYVDVGLGQIHPLHFDKRPDLLAVGEGDMRRALERVLRSLTALGCANLMFSIGTLEDRFDTTTPWNQQLQATCEFLLSLKPVLQDLGCRLTLKTHEEITTFEILRLIETVGPDVLGVCLDPVNVLARLEDPLRATRRLAPYVRQVVVDDALVRLTNNGLERWLCPCGSGVLDWPSMLSLLPNYPENVRLVVELHRAFLEMPIFDAVWRAAQPDLSVSELVALVELVQASVSRPFDPSYQHDPWKRLEPTLAYLRGMTAG